MVSFKMVVLDIAIVTEWLKYLNARDFKGQFAIGIESPSKHSGFVVFKIVAILRFSMS